VRILKLFILGVLLPVSVSAQTGFLDRAVTVKGETFRYQVYVPADYASRRSWPVIVFLHGNGDQGSDGRKHTERGLAERIRKNPSQFPAIIVFPQARVGTRWFNPEMEALVLAGLKHTTDEFRADRHRIYLTGFSMGATGAYRIARRRPEKFAAVVAVAGRVEPGSKYTTEEIEVDRRANPFVAEPDPFLALARGVKDIPMWVFHGDNDEQVPVEQSRRLMDALKKVGAKIRYTEYTGVDHVGAARRAFGEADMLEWLFRQRR
jgi:predicted peptidase